MLYLLTCDEIDIIYYYYEYWICVIRTVYFLTMNNDNNAESKTTKPFCPFSVCLSLSHASIVIGGETMKQTYFTMKRKSK